VHASDVRPGGRRCKHTAAHRAPAQPGPPPAGSSGSAPVAVDGDVYREIAAFRGGAATGSTTIDGVTLGLALQP
jgi:hypothetical protein